jgi:methylglyoxal synthase
VFIVDPLDKHPHDPDIQTLMRICNVRNVPLATNIATADILISSTSYGNQRRTEMEKRSAEFDRRVRRRTFGG